MSVKISGVMKDAMGKPIPDCTIALKALHTSATVITKTIGSLQPEENGSYSMDVELGKYSVTLCVEGYPPNDVGEIYVHSQSVPGTLNYYLGLPTEGDLPPAAIQQFEAMVELVSQQAAQVEKDKAAAAASAKAAKLSETNANTSETNAGKSAAAALVSEKAAKTSETNTAKGIEAAAASAQAAKLSETNADGSKKAAQASAAEALASQGAAKTSETNAGNSAKAASGSADKAKSEADRATTATDGKQDKNALLTAIAALNTAADQIITLTGKNSVATAVLTKFAKEMLAKTDAAGVREYLGLKEVLIRGDCGVGSKSDYLPASLNGASGFFGAGSYVVGTSAAVVVQSSYGAERRGQLAVNMANEAFFRFCNSASESATTHPWKQLVSQGSVANFTSVTASGVVQGTQLAANKETYPTISMICSSISTATSVGSRLNFEIAGDQPYVVMRRADGSSANQVLINFPKTSKGQFATEATCDANLKKNIQDYDGVQSLNNINAMELKTYIFKDDEKNRVRRGVIAQQIEQIDPEYVKDVYQQKEDETPYTLKVLDGNALLLDALAAIQVLSQKIKVLEE
ncbi:prophage tail fiber N-terminal domain-containing protein [Hafnia alvei]|uniref:prophage tail fiber N-terminal domain-containing protein n=1 Tax=Hafnia alvei TaxID=569 RepID=UPI00345ED570